MKKRCKDGVILLHDLFSCTQPSRFLWFLALLFPYSSERYLALNLLLCFLVIQWHTIMMYRTHRRVLYVYTTFSELLGRFCWVEQHLNRIAKDLKKLRTLVRGFRKLLYVHSICMSACHPYIVLAFKDSLILESRILFELKQP